MIGKDEVQHVARLARVQLAEEELEKFQKEFSEILAYFEKLSSVGTEDVEPLTHSVQVENISREDAAVDPDPALRARLCKLAGMAKNGFLKVPSVLRTHG